MPSYNKVGRNFLVKKNPKLSFHPASAILSRIQICWFHVFSYHQGKCKENSEFLWWYQSIFHLLLVIRRGFHFLIVYVIHVLWRNYVSKRRAKSMLCCWNFNHWETLLTHFLNFSLKTTVFFFMNLYFLEGKSKQED